MVVSTVTMWPSASCRTLMGTPMTDMMIMYLFSYFGSWDLKYCVLDTREFWRKNVKLSKLS